MRFACAVSRLALRSSTLWLDGRRIERDENITLVDRGTLGDDVGDGVEALRVTDDIEVVDRGQLAVLGDLHIKIHRDDGIERAGEWRVALAKEVALPDPAGSPTRRQYRRTSQKTQRLRTESTATGKLGFKFVKLTTPPECLPPPAAFVHHLWIGPSINRCIDGLLLGSRLAARSMAKPSAPALGSTRRVPVLRR